MPNENDSNPPRTDTEFKLPQQRPISAAPSTPPHYKVSDEQNKRTSSDSETAKELAREFKWVEFAQLAVNALLAVVGIVALFIYHGQLEVMRGQLGEIVRQYPEIKKTADAANTTLIEGRDTTAKQLEKLDSYIVEARTSNQLAIQSNRPWIGYVSRQPGEPDEERFKHIHDNTGESEWFQYIWKVKNSGKRPALIETIRTVGYWDETCTDHPDYNFLPPAGVLLEPSKHGSRASVIPDSTMKSLFVTRIPWDKWMLIDASPPKLLFCIYSRLEYRDVDYPAVLHHTQECRYLIELAGNQYTFGVCANNYARTD